MAEWPWPSDHPKTKVMKVAIALPFTHWVDGWPVVSGFLRWPGRGLASEIGVRAYGAWLREKPGWWPPILDEFERLLDA